MNRPYVPSFRPNCTPTACGNGVQTVGESCDDGNLNSGDGCRTIDQVRNVQG